MTTPEPSDVDIHRIEILEGCFWLVMQGLGWLAAWFLVLTLSLPKPGWLGALNWLSALFSIYFVTVLARVTTVDCDIHSPQHTS